MIAERETHISNGSVVVVDDEPMVREVVSRYLRRDGFKVSTAADGLEALNVIHSTGELSRDLNSLRSTTLRVAAGDLSARSPTNRTDELGALAEAFNDMSRRLEEAEAAPVRTESARRSFLASVSHDLRTPLTAMRVAIEALEDDIAPDPERYLESLGKDVDALSRLVDDLFLLSRIESGHLGIDSWTQGRAVL